MYKLTTTYKKILADVITPVSVYLKLRDEFPGSLLLESSDYHANTNSFSYICCNPIADISIGNGVVRERFPDGTEVKKEIGQANIPKIIEEFAGSFQTEATPFPFINNGLFGYIAYDGVRYFEKIAIEKKPENYNIPDIFYAVYQNIIAINHFNNEAYIFDHSFNSEGKLQQIEQFIKAQNVSTYPFYLKGQNQSNETDEGYKTMVKKAKEHCLRGDVFQLVLSRRFSQKFKGDEFNVYRALRNVNPSPYLFYFDYGNFKIFGSSPEAQLVVKGERAEIHPIAGTYKRTGNDEQDAELAKKLAADQKENSEHVMLVDLARNDLSRHGSEVKVETFKEIQYFSHVIHLVSKVVARKKNTATMQIVADTFPAGTLSGAPKPKALELIERYERTNRGFYGGAIGFMDFDGNFNHAITIRSFLSKNHELFYQAGAGIVADSNEDKELEEIFNKVGALRKALEIAEKI